jgi:V/A-type H+/Na+-transporting ATPase subunit D
VGTTARTPATRSSLMKLRRRLDQVERGAALLRRKRESLVAELFARARTAIDGRRGIEEQARRAYQALLAALGSQGRDELAALGWPSRELSIELEPLEVWGLKVVDLVRPPNLVRSLGARAMAPGSADATPVTAAAEMERLLELVLAAAPKEFLMRRLGQELSRATRLVNTLEQRVALDLSQELGRIRRTLEEREREEHLRLKHLGRRRSVEKRSAGE